MLLNIPGSGEMIQPFSWVSAYDCVRSESFGSRLFCFYRAMLRTNDPLGVR